MMLDLFLGSQMRESSDLRERLSSAGVEKSQLLEVKDRAKRVGLLRGRTIPLDDYVGFFGEPLETTRDALWYALRLWPDHLFEAGINEFGGVFERGFVLKEETPIIRPAALELGAVRQQFRPGFHTMEEVARALGTPDKDQAWGAMEDWLYGPVTDDKYLAFEFDFRLLSGVQLRPYVSLDR